MKINKTLLSAGFLLFAFLLWPGLSGICDSPVDRYGQQSRPYTGKFIMNSGQVVLTLQLTQGADNSVTGTLSSSNGSVFQVKGSFEGNGVATGTCTTQQGGVYFEAYIEGNEMTFSLVEPGADGQPDYDKARYLVFNRAGAVPAAAAAQGAAYGGTQNAGNAGPVNIYQQQQQQQYPQQPQQQYQQQYQQQPQQQYQQQQQYPQQQYGNYQNAGMGQMAGGGARPNEVGDDAWGFRFVPPQGWVSQKNANGIVLGHNTVAGMILVFPHTSTSMQQMQGLMMQGIQEEGSSLMPVGAMRPVNNNTLMGDYSGVVSGQQVKAVGYGVLSPYGGGAFILAMTTPDKMSNQLAGAARQIATTMRYVRPSAGSSGLVQFFSGVWVTSSTNTYTKVYLYPDGTWSDHYEASYSGDFSNSGGNTGSWGAGGAQNSRGRWRVSGNRDQGQLILIYPNGEQEAYQYQVHVENGQKYYSEYYFNGTLFHRQNKYDE
jgi:hypothetical protein